MEMNHITDSSGSEDEEGPVHQDNEDANRVDEVTIRYRPERANSARSGESIEREVSLTAIHFDGVPVLNQKPLELGRDNSQGFTKSKVHKPTEFADANGDSVPGDVGAAADPSPRPSESPRNSPSPARPPAKRNESPKWSVERLMLQVKIIVCIGFVMDMIGAVFEILDFAEVESLVLTIIVMLTRVLISTIGLLGAVYRSRPLLVAFVCMTLIWSTASFSRSVANYTLTLNNCKMVQTAFKGCHVDDFPCASNNTCTEEDLAGTECQAVGMDYCADFFGVGRLIKVGLLTLFRLFSGATMPAYFSFLGILRMPRNA